MKLVSMVVHLKPIAGKPGSTLQDSVYAHASIMQLLSQRDLNLARRAHDAGPHRTFTLAVLEGPADTRLLRMTFFDPKDLALADGVASALTSTSVLRFGVNEWQISGFSLSNSTWARVATLEDVIDNSFQRRFRFHFASPTAFHRTNRHRKRFTGLLPEPERVFGSLARRWSDLIDLELPSDLDSWLSRGGCVISDYKLQTTKTSMPERTQIGFVGTVAYECLDDSRRHVAAINYLSRIAFFVGVGCQTARGMGVVRTETLGEESDVQ